MTTFLPMASSASVRQSLDLGGKSGDLVEKCRRRIVLRDRSGRGSLRCGDRKRHAYRVPRLRHGLLLGLALAVQLTRLAEAGGGEVGELRLRGGLEERGVP